MLALVALLAVDVLQEGTFGGANARVQAGPVVAHRQQGQGTARDGDGAQLQGNAVVRPGDADVGVHVFGQAEGDQEI